MSSDHVLCYLSICNLSLCLYKYIYFICYPIERLLECIHKAQKVVAETQLELRAQLSTPKR